MSKPKNMTPQKTTDEKAELQKEIQKLQKKEKELRPTDKEDEYKRVYNQLEEKRKKLDGIEKKENKIKSENFMKWLIKKTLEENPNVMKIREPFTFTEKDKNEILDLIKNTYEKHENKDKGKKGNIN